MEPEELDVVELLEDVAVEPGWRVSDKHAVPVLRAGTRGMVVHRHLGDSALYDVEFLDQGTGDAIALAVLPASRMRVVERDTLGGS